MPRAVNQSEFIARKNFFATAFSVLWPFQACTTQHMRPPRADDDGLRRHSPPPMGSLATLGRHVPHKARQVMTDLYLGGGGIEAIDGKALEEYESLECLWLNDNQISKVQGLGRAFRLKELYLQNNAIVSISSPSCSLRHIKFLQASSHLDGPSLDRAPPMMFCIRLFP